MQASTKPLVCDKARKRPTMHVAVRGAMAEKSTQPAIAPLACHLYALAKTRLSVDSTEAIAESSRPPAAQIVKTDEC